MKYSEQQKQIKYHRHIDAKIETIAIRIFLENKGI